MPDDAPPAVDEILNVDVSPDVSESNVADFDRSLDDFIGESSGDRGSGGEDSNSGVESTPGDSQSSSAPSPESNSDSAAETTPPASPSDAAPPSAEESEAPLQDEHGPITPPENINPKNLGNFRRLEAVARRNAADAQQYKQEVEQLRANGNGAIPENVEKELVELRQFRAMHDLRSDPQFIEKYDTAAKTHEQSIVDVLKKNGAKDEQVEALLKNGISKYSPAWWDKNVLTKIPSLEADRIKRSLIAIDDLASAKEKELQTNASKIEEINQQRLQEQQRAYEQEQSVIESRSNELFKQMPWAQRQQVPAGATAEQKKSIEDHNREVEQIETMFNAALYPSDPKHRAEVAVAAVVATRLSQVAQSQAQLIEKLKSEVASLKTARKLPAAKSTSNSAPKRGDGVASVADGFDEVSSDEAIERGLDEAMGN